MFWKMVNRGFFWNYRMGLNLTLPFSSTRESSINGR